MKPRRLHSDTIFSISSVALGSAISGRGVFGKPLAMSRNGLGRNGSRQQKPLSSFRSRLWQVHPEGAPLPEGRLDAHRRVHTLGRLLNNGQTNACARIIADFVKSF